MEENQEKNCCCMEQKLQKEVNEILQQYTFLYHKNRNHFYKHNSSYFL